MSARNKFPMYCKSKHNNRTWYIKPYNNLTLLLLLEGKTTFQPYSNPPGHRIIQSFQFVQIGIHVSFFYLFIQITAFCE